MNVLNLKKKLIVLLLQNASTPSFMNYNLGELKHEMIKELLQNPFNTLMVVAGCALIYTISNFAATTIEYFKVKMLNDEKERMSIVMIIKEKRMSEVLIEKEEQMSKIRISELASTCSKTL